MTEEELLEHLQTHPDHEHLRLVKTNLNYEHNVCHNICVMKHTHDEHIPHNPFIGAHADEDVAWEDA